MGVKSRGAGERGALQHGARLQNGTGTGLCQPCIKRFRSLPNHKSDSNNDSGISTDYIGMNHSYVEADHEMRAAMFRSHETIKKDLIWTVQNHPRVPRRFARSIGHGGCRWMNSPSRGTGRRSFISVKHAG